MKRVVIYVMFCIVLANTAKAQTHWESIVTESDEFTYIVPNVVPPAAWIELSYDDSAWNTGNGGFGFGDNDDNTIVTSSTSIYIRRTFNMPASATISTLYFDMDYDDAFVAYLNGVEIARSSNLPDGTPGLTANLSTDHEAVLYSGGNPERFVLNPSSVVTGDNILAVQVLNWNATSSDMSARIFLNAELSGDDILFSTLPDWFYLPPVESTSNLPLVIIDTEGLSIPDEPKIMAKMKVINKPGGENRFSDTVYEYDGDIGIEIRGNTAQGFAKKSYTVETRLADGSNNNVELLGMPMENDWVFHGPYVDKSLMRNALAYHIGNAMGRWSPRTRFVEVMINNEYLGVYLVAEKIKIDKNRVDIATLKPEDISGDELTGGYIMSIDRTQEGSFNSPYIGRTGTYPVTISYVDPKYDEITEEQRNYIKEYIFSFEDALAGDDFQSPELGYRNYINEVSFIDYFFITELSKDIDGYRVSVFFHKDKDSNGGKLTMSPFWDYNLCFGNANFYGGGITTGWTSDDKPDGIGSGDQGNEIPFWWERFREDPYYETTMKYRWEKLRKGVLHKDSLNAFIDSCQTVLDEAQKRNFDRWDILGTYLWPNPYVGGTYENEVNYLKTFVSERIDWLDARMDEIVPTFPNAIENAEADQLAVLAYPNPFKDNITLEFKLAGNEKVELVVRNILGEVIFEKSKEGINGRNAFIIDSGDIGSEGNIFFYTLQIGQQKISSGKLVRY